MIKLLLVSLIWAFSFGLIKMHLTSLPSAFVAFARLALAIPVFLPFLSLGQLSNREKLKLLFIGAIQYGVMYIAYLKAFQFLDAYLIALFTIFTPLYVSILSDWHQRRFNHRNIILALLAVIGAGVIQYHGIGNRIIVQGFLLVQLSNLCFAWGQLAYRRFRLNKPAVQDHKVYAFLFIGAALVTLPFALPDINMGLVKSMDWTQLAVLVYLGTIASGFCFFWWNQGAIRVNPATLAVMNNLKIPLAVAVSLLVFGESTDLPRLIIGGSIMVLALWLAQKRAG